MLAIMHRLASMPFAKVYPAYVAKAERKNRTQQELDSIIEWLLGHDPQQIAFHVAQGTPCEAFFMEADLNERAHLITGVVCGVRVESIDDPFMRRVRYLDKLIDELAKGKSMDKILRQ